MEGLGPDVLLYRIEGVLFFGAAAQAGPLLDRLGGGYRHVVLDCAGVPFMDSTAANLIEGALRKAEKTGADVIITGAQPLVRAALESHEVHEPRVRFLPDIPAAVVEIRKAAAKIGGDAHFAGMKRMLQ